MTEKVELAKDGKIQEAKNVLAQSVQERDTQMERLSYALMEHTWTETRLMVHMYESLPAVYRGEMTGSKLRFPDHLCWMIPTSTWSCTQQEIKL